MAATVHASHPLSRMVNGYSLVPDTCSGYGGACYALRMKLLQKVNDQVSLQILCDLLESGGITYRVEGAGMNSLMPLPGVIEARVLVEEEGFEAAQQLLAEFGSE